MYEGAGATGHGRRCRTSEHRTPDALAHRRAPVAPSAPLPPDYLLIHVHRHPLRLQRRHRGRRAAALRGADRHAGRVRLSAGPRHLLSRLPRLRRPRVLPLHLRARAASRWRRPAAGGDRAEERPLRARHPRARCSSSPAPPSSSRRPRSTAIQLAVVSGALRREIELVLSLAGLRPHFAEIVAAEDVGACKPDPQGYSGRRAAGAGAEAVRGGGGLAPGAGRGARRRAALRRADHVAPTDAFAEADLVWSDFAGRRAGRAALGPCLIST